MARRAGLEVAVEDRGGGSDQRAPGLGDPDLAARDLDQAVGRHPVKGRDLLGEVGGVGPVAGAEASEVDLQAAHQGLDHGPAQPVVGAEPAAAPDGGAPGGHRVAVVLDRHGVLDVALGQAADRRGAQADQGLGRVVGVALEVAPQAVLTQGPGQGVLRAGEVVEADAEVTMGPEPCRRGLGLGPARVLLRQLRVRDQPLVGLHPGHVGIAEERDAVRRQGRREVDAAQQVGDPLPRQAVHQVEVDAPDAGRAQALDRPRHHLEGLDAVDRRLHGGGEVLDAEAGAGHAGLGEGPGLFRVQGPGVDLDRDLDRRVEAEGRAQAVGQAPEVVARQHRRGAAAPVQLHHARAGRQGSGNQLGLLQQAPGVVRDRLVAPHHLGVAAAVPAHLRAEGHVQIERKPGLRRQAAEPPKIALGGDPGVEVRCRGIAGIARHRAAVAAQKLWIHGRDASAAARQAALTSIKGPDPIPPTCYTRGLG